MISAGGLPGGQMGIFWERAVQPPPTPADEAVDIHEAYQEPTDAERAAHARGRAQAIAQTPEPAKLKAVPLLVAFGVVVAFVVGGVVAEAIHLPDSSKALFGLATTAFGLVVGLLTGEKSNSS